MRRGYSAVPGVPVMISIPTQPEGRVQRVASSRRRWHRGRFQSPLSPKAECNPDDPYTHDSTQSFQSPLSPKAECNTESPAPALVCRSFNPHSARRPSATHSRRESRCLPVMCKRFNPHSARRPSATRFASGHHRHRLRFNPHSARRPSATAKNGGRSQRQSLFQSPLSPKAECNPVR